MTIQVKARSVSRNRLLFDYQKLHDEAGLFRAALLVDTKLDKT